jgi:hypothetical protein
VPGTIAGVMIRANTRKRIHAISIEGNVADKYFAVTSEVPRNTVDARINAIPLNGRSVRAGARRADGFRSGKGNGSLASLAAAAVGGVTIKTLADVDSGSAMKTIIASARQHPKTGCRYARMGCGSLPRRNRCGAAKKRL